MESVGRLIRGRHFTKVDCSQPKAARENKDETHRNIAVVPYGHAQV